MALTARLPGDPLQPSDFEGVNSWVDAPFWVDDSVPDAFGAEPSVTLRQDDIVVPEAALLLDPETLLPPDIVAADSGGGMEALGYGTGTVITQAGFATLGTAVTDNSSVHALRVDIAKSTYTVPVTNHVLDGTGLKIGILSDSFNLLGGEANDQANGDLGSSITILKEGSTGRDEGRAMAQLIHSIAPNAQIFFYTATSSEADFANGIKTLAAQGCTVIVDDVVYFDEPFYQDTGVVTKAVEQVIGQGVSYFTAAGNSGKNYYENTFNPLTTTLDQLGTVTAHDIGGGTPFEKVELSANAVLDFTLEWTEPYSTSPGSTRQYDIGVALFDSAGTFVQKWTLGNLRGNPVLEINTTLTNAAGVYSLVFYESSGTVTPGTFKLIMFQGSTATIDGVGAGFGSGTSIGHQTVAAANTVAAVSYAQTPANGVATPVVESFSGTGPAVTYINSSGTTLATPIVSNNPDFAATDGSPTSVFNPFFGTSAAAPNAAAVDLLVIQADSRLSNVQQSYVLSKSAVSTGDTTSGGAGLIQADVAVGFAVSAATTPIWQGFNGVGTGTWSTANDWSNNAVPASTDQVTIGNGIGTLSGSYTVTFDPASGTIGGLLVDGGASTVQPDLKINAAHSLGVSGNVTVGSGTIDVSGTLAVSGGLLGNALSGTGINIASGGLLTVAGGDALAIGFSGTGGTVILSASDSTTLLGGFTGTIGNFNLGDTLELSGLAWSSALSIAYSNLTASIFSSTTNNVVAQLALQGGFSGLSLARDSTTNGTIIVACYVRGTLVLTPDGLREVEALAIGDLVTTVDGAAKPIRWIGRRSYGGPFLRSQPALLPIRIRAGALDDGVPSRDLLVSPEHAMFLDGALVPAVDLVNGVSIVQDSAAEHVEYFHVELAEHDLIWAEGAASETFVDDGGRGIFHNAHDYWRHHPQSLRAPAKYCAPRLKDGYALEALRQRLAGRAGLAVAVPDAARLQGWLELAGPQVVAGWARDPDHADAPVCLDIAVDGVVVMQVLANRHRPDFEAAGIGAWCGFYAELPARTTGSVEVWRSIDCVRLPVAHAAGPAITRAA
jgi:hypothetical protein